LLFVNGVKQQQQQKLFHSGNNFLQEKENIP
jgi:hypothetical protein